MTIVAVLAMLLAVAWFAPVIPAKVAPPSQVAFLGPLPAYESLSCAVVGAGTGYWESVHFGGPYWSYYTQCPSLKTSSVVQTGTPTIYQTSSTNRTPSPPAVTQTPTMP